jgi:hypothetical protein
VVHAPGLQHHAREDVRRSALATVRRDDLCVDAQRLVDVGREFCPSLQSNDEGVRGPSDVMGGSGGQERLRVAGLPVDRDYGEIADGGCDQIEDQVQVLVDWGADVLERFSHAYIAKLQVYKHFAEGVAIECQTVCIQP